MTLVPAILRLLEQEATGDVVLAVGGTIPDEDGRRLRELGVAQVFTPGTPSCQIPGFFREAVAARRAGAATNEPSA
jgi:methylmalonyl-CoA mutase C-terminal domain/subunit